MELSAIAVEAETRRSVVEGVARTLTEYYVFPELAEKMVAALTNDLNAGKYDDLTNAEAFCNSLTEQLQAICGDQHVRVRYNEEPRPVDFSDEDTPEALAEWQELGRSANFGFYKIERLAGNIGYLDLRNFWEVTFPGAGETAVGAMNLLAHTEAIIFDMRQNGGGSPSMVSFLTSYLVGPEPVHLNSFYFRKDGNTRQSWTLPYVPGQRMPDKPVYILTSSRTFSGAEEFTYNLKHLKRATIIGETTKGGAHPGGDISVTPHFRVFVPAGRPINAVTGTNWEGVGVEPDIAVPADDALKHAHRLALEALLEKLKEATSGPAKAQAEEAREALNQLNADD